MFAFPVVFRRVVHLGVAGCHFVERVERFDTLAAGEVLNLHAAVGHVGQTLRETLCTGAEPGEIAWPSAYHHDLGTLLGDGGRTDGGRGGHSAQSQGAGLQYVTSFHDCSLDDLAFLCVF